MANGLSGYGIGLGLVALFAFFIFACASSFIGTTNPSSPILQNQYMNNSVKLMNNTVSNFNSLQGDISNKMQNSQPSATDYLFLIFQGAFTIPLSFFVFILSSIGNLELILFTGMSGTGFGSLSLILGFITSSIIITGVVLIVQAIRTGQLTRS